ncbi:DUF3307 domain-containing protein [Kaistella jeonii]|uniref:DUF3307 domain-containing protein n=1 Tax=Kaistella jeonii TaxID=266749 RepID=A0A0C1CVE1_9FLAO|nr:DUF3307 domain-containing protein [Kaistella jeonii]KIA88316.1 hypothetical protein OA86_11355 [Kaistella jeonii]SFC24022.1 Protein of unknown function [Kaistella jeonii]VEI94588.1 Protein of uncharacterised function (DUF3307) [Kaistella jeonii]
MIFIPLILAHLLGDFILQPNSWVADKEQKRGGSIYLYIHILLHTVLAFLFLWNFNLWWIALIIGVTHFLIDWAKLKFQAPKTKRTWFFIDQIAHILVIVAISIFYFPYFKWEDFFNPENLKLFTAFVFLSVPSSILIKTIISIWTPITIEHSKLQTESLVNAGKYIGILERLLVFVFILVNHWEGVGFMIAAKSVFRFSDLAEAKQRKLTEYVLIGTLLSFGIAVLTGILVKI